MFITTCGTVNLISWSKAGTTNMNHGTERAWIGKADFDIVIPHVRLDLHQPDSVESVAMAN